MNVLEALRPVIQAGKAVRKCGWCLIHQQECWLEETDLHTAGTPCRDDSQQGQQDGLDGKQTTFLLACIALRMLLQESVVLQDRSTHTYRYHLLLLLVWPNTSTTHPTNPVKKMIV